jgi:hypothetical protein
MDLELRFSFMRDRTVPMGMAACGASGLNSVCHQAIAQ